jgi:glycine cleavage system regulatory protein
MIRFIRTASNDQNIITSRIEIEVPDDISLPDLQDEFKRFCMAVGYSPACFEDEPIMEDNE